MPLLSRVAALLVAVALSGCASMAEQITPRAAHDFGCPAGDVQVERIDQNTAGASGCGQRATYIKHCSGTGVATRCEWNREPG